MTDEYFLEPEDIKIGRKYLKKNLNRKYIKLSEGLYFSKIDIFKKDKNNSLTNVANLDMQFFEKKVSSFKNFKNIKERIKKIYSKSHFPKKLFFKNPLIMGVLNLTKDSFYDGGMYFEKKSALSKAYSLIEEGADIIDIGAESTRPGAHAIQSEEEIKRILPIASKLSKENIILSCDTRNSETMRAALDVGVKIINDVSGLNYDSNTLNILKSYDCYYVLTHSQGKPSIMQNNPQYKNSVCDIYGFFNERLKFLSSQGFPLSRIIIDPGIGFGKNDIHNFNILKHLGIFLDIGLPILIGLSRKSLIGRFINDTPKNSLSCSLVLAVDAYMKGVNLIRVHDVKETINAINIIKHANY
tara:strand:- start:564 stop:1631 length:1068 start_codon:yes stop_codon:yes gene_type:complete